MIHKFSGRLRRPVAIGASVFMMAALGACGSSGSDSDTESIVIGYSAGLSGGAAAYGKNIENGLKLAVQDLNEEGITVDGDDYKVELKSLDDEYDPSQTGTNVQRLVDQDDANVVVVPHAGGIKASQELQDSGRAEFLLVAYSSDPAIVEQGTDLTVMVPPSFESYVPAFIKKFKDQGAEKLGLLATSSEFGQQWTESMTKQWKEQGGEVLSDNSLDYGTVSDFAGPVSKTLGENPDTILIGGPSQPTALIIEEARKQGYDGSFMIVDQAKYEEMEQVTDPKNLNNTIGVAPVREYQEPGTEGFIDEYKDEIGEDEQPLTPETTLNYQSLPIIVKAMEEAGTTDDVKAIREAIPDALGDVEDRFQVTGFPDKITDKGHLLADDLKVAYRDKDGKFDLIPVDQPEE